MKESTSTSIAFRVYGQIPSDRDETLKPSYEGLNVQYDTFH